MANDDELEVDRDALARQAQAWVEHGSELGTYGHLVLGTSYPVADAGIFASVTEVYNQVCTDVAGWVSQGQAQMSDISAELKANAGRYHQTESENARLSSRISDAINY